MAHAVSLPSLFAAKRALSGMLTFISTELYSYFEEKASMCNEAEVFEELVGTLRVTEEWTYVEREIDIRLVAEDAL